MRAPVLALVLSIASMFAGNAFAQSVDFSDSIATRRSIAVESMRGAENRMEMARKTDAAVFMIIKTAAWKLRLMGRGDDADRMLAEYAEHYAGYVEYVYGSEIVPVDLGDHAPLNQWLAAWYQLMLLTLGEDLCRLLHLDDINIVNYAIPVVFFRVPERIDQAEYALHFVPLAGVVTYWTAWGVCVGATWGTGIILICTPVGMAAEWITVKWLAPPISDWVWDRFNPYDQVRRVYDFPLIDLLVPTEPDLSDMPAN